MGDDKGFFGKLVGLFTDNGNSEYGSHEISRVAKAEREQGATSIWQSQSESAADFENRSIYFYQGASDSSSSSDSSGSWSSGGGDDSSE